MTLSTSSDEDPFAVTKVIRPITTLKDQLSQKLISMLMVQVIHHQNVMNVH